MTEPVSGGDSTNEKRQAALAKARNLGLAFIGLGFIELAWALFCVFGGLLLGVMGFVDDQFFLMFGLSGMYAVLAVFATGLGALHVVTGLKLRRGTGLLWVLASIAAGLAGFVLALYCFPFILAVLIYAAVVIGDAEVRAALDPPPA